MYTSTGGSYDRTLRSQRYLISSLKLLCGGLASMAGVRPNPSRIISEVDMDPRATLMLSWRIVSMTVASSHVRPASYARRRAGNIDQERYLKLNSTSWFLELADLRQQGVVTIDRPHEMRDDRRAFFIEKANISLVLAPYANELRDYQKYGKHALLVHQPHAIDSTFVRDVEATRSNDVLLAGGLTLDFYPLRHRFSELIRDKKMSGRVHRWGRICRYND